MARVSLGPESDFPPGSSRVVEHENLRIAVFRREDGFHAVDDVCPHMGGSLGMGWCTDDGSVVCPLHGWEFRLSDGRGVWPAGLAIPTYSVRHEGADLFLVVEQGADARS